jgi:crotonobetainyl-CoA:carnitine CoA-transferase CaiB-like acyl-CoA transferase
MVVADFTAMVAGAYCTRLLADCGAEVIKVEGVDGGDMMRRVGPAAGGVDLVFALYNTGKKSVALDLKSPAGLEVARRLVERADVLVENFRPGVMARLGLGYEAVRGSNPGLVYCSVSGFGQKGPLADRAAYAPVAQAFSGFEMMLAQLPDASAPPLDNRLMIGDVVAGAFAFGAIQTALVDRLRHGAGKYVDVSMAEAMMSLVGMQLQSAQAGKPYSGPSYPAYKTQDGYVSIPLVSPLTWIAAIKVMKRADWLQDPSMASLGGIMGRRDEIVAALAAWCSDRSSSECETEMTAGGVPCSPYLLPHETIDHPQMVSRQSFSPVQGGAFMVLNPPFHLDGAPLEAGQHTPGLGEDTETVLRDRLGLSAAACKDLAAGGAFGKSPAAAG